ncbi:MAG: hypothetical protein M1831_006911 [Alyxoria varia]|nr:MAG: hypothetical protein M1831_006911 [Alyxoria varia]
MDPATAFQVACSALQLAHLCHKGVKTAQQAYNSTTGLSHANETIEEEAKDIDRACTFVKDGLSSLRSVECKLSPTQKDLQRVCDDCIRLSNELRTILDRLRPEQGGTRRRFVDRLKNSYMQRNNIKELEEQLDKRRKQLDTDILVVLSQQVDRADFTQRQILLQIDLKALEQSHAFKRFDRDFRASIEELQIAREDIKQHTTKIVERSQTSLNKRSLIQNLIDSLSFDDIYLRQSQIKDASKGTFAWLFSAENAERRRWSNFIQWLERGDDIYWVNGKVGSGKSTLMKYVADNPTTRKMLCRWTGDKKLVIPKFFFWRNGSGEQKSIAGLLRSTIVQIIECCPDQAGILFEYLSGSDAPYNTNGLGFKFPGYWDFKKLSDALLHLLRNITQHCKVFFLLDGLDEFEDNAQDQESLIDLVQELSQIENVKLLVSSRPEPCLIAAFEDSPKLKLQDLNENDIHIYITERLKKSPRMKRKLEENEGGLEHYRAEELIRNVRNKADGVFMWAALAVRDLLNGLSRMDELKQLEERLDRMNSNLERLFGQMVDAIEEIHLPQAAKLLNYTLNKHCSLFEVACSIGWVRSTINFESPGSRTLTQKDAQKTQQTFQDLTAVCLTQCAGLLDIEDECNEQPLSPVHLRLVHRSAYDFLRENEKARKLLEADMGSESDISGQRVLGQRGLVALSLQIALDAAHVVRDMKSRELKTLKSGEGIAAYFDSPKAFNQIRYLLCYIAEAQDDTERKQNLENVLIETGIWVFSTCNKLFEYIEVSILELCVRRRRMTCMLMAAITTMDDLVMANVFFGFHQDHREKAETHVPLILRTIRQILLLGADPAVRLPRAWDTRYSRTGTAEKPYFLIESTAGFTLWQLFLAYVSSVSCNDPKWISPSILEDTIQAFLNAGADIQAPLAYENVLNLHKLTQMKQMKERGARSTTKVDRISLMAMRQEQGAQRYKVRIYPQQNELPDTDTTRIVEAWVAAWRQYAAGHLMKPANEESALQQLHLVLKDVCCAKYEGQIGMDAGIQWDHVSPQQALDVGRFARCYMNGSSEGYEKLRQYLHDKQIESPEEALLVRDSRHVQTGPDSDCTSDCDVEKDHCQAEGLEKKSPAAVL